MFMWQPWRIDKLLNGIPVGQPARGFVFAIDCASTAGYLKDSAQG